MCDRWSLHIKKRIRKVKKSGMCAAIRINELSSANAVIRCRGLLVFFFFLFLLGTGSAFSLLAEHEADNGIVFKVLGLISAL